MVCLVEGQIVGLDCQIVVWAGWLNLRQIDDLVSNAIGWLVARQLDGWLLDGWMVGC